MLYPLARALLKLLEDNKVPPVHTLTPQQGRDAYKLRRALTQPDPPEVAAVWDTAAPGPAGEVPVRCYRPMGSTPAQVLPALVYYHGGGWTIGDRDTHDTLCRTLANGAGCMVVSVDYRMGPEHRFPAAVDDSFAALQWVHAQAATLHIDPARIAVGGDSAGGNLAAVMALMARDAGGPAIRFQLLIYPATDMRGVHDSHRRNGQGYLLTRDSIDWFQDHYTGDPSKYTDWRASPALAANHAQLPPALVLVAGYDPLRDEGVEYAQKLNEASVDASLVSFERQIHGFITMGRVMPESNAAVRVCVAELRHALA